MLQWELEFVTMARNGDPLELAAMVCDGWKSGTLNNIVFVALAMVIGG